MKIMKNPKSQHGMPHHVVRIAEGCRSNHGTPSILTESLLTTILIERITMQLTTNKSPPEPRLVSQMPSLNIRQNPEAAAITKIRNTVAFATIKVANIIPLLLTRGSFKRGPQQTDMCLLHYQIMLQPKYTIVILRSNIPNHVVSLQ
jgi:hypothetical protein